jgi:hypothetical protein
MRLAHRVGLVLIAAAMLLIGAWCSVATWYGCGAGEPLRSLLAAAAAAFTIFAVACLATRRRWPAFAVYSGAVAGNAGLGAGIGAAAGPAGGLIYDQVKRGQASSYQAGYQAGSRGAPPNPPQ